MQIRVINPNTTRGMTDTIGSAAQAIASPGTVISATQPAHGPVSIESHFDEAISAMGVLEEVAAGERDGVDAYIIACFGDPGLLAARELTRAPVLGIAEAAFHMATLISTRFSVVTTLGRTGIIAEHLLDQYGFRHHCRRVRAAEIPVLDLEDDGDAALTRIIEEGRRARDEDGIGALVLGCGGIPHRRDRRGRGSAGGRGCDRRGEADRGAGRPGARHQQAWRPGLPAPQGLRRPLRSLHRSVTQPLSGTEFA